MHTPVRSTKMEKTAASKFTDKQLARNIYKLSGMQASDIMPSIYH